MDVLWFRLPRHPGETPGGLARIGHGHMLVMLNRGDHWQIAFLILKGTYREVREAGLEIAGSAPKLRRRGFVGASSELR